MFRKKGEATMAKMYSLTIRNRAAAVALAAVVIGVGAVMLTVGLALLAGLVLAGGVLGAGFGIYNRLRGRRPGALPPRAGQQWSGLDPSLEIRAPQQAIVRLRDDENGQPPA